MGSGKPQGTDNGNSTAANGNGGKAGGDASANGSATGTGAGAGAGTGAGAGAGTGTATGTGAGAGAGQEGSRNNAAVNPASLAPDDYERDETGAIILNSDGSKRKKRGRKKGQHYSGASSSATKPSGGSSRKSDDRAAMATEMLAAQFQILNTGIAYLTRFDDWKLDDDEAKQMAEATSNVMAQFDYVPDPKVAAILGLVTTTSMIYGPRAYLYRKHLQQKHEGARNRKIQEADERAANNGMDGGPMNLGQFSG
jgi:hypothetical protein